MTELALKIEFRESAFTNNISKAGVVGEVYMCNYKSLVAYVYGVMDTNTPT